MQNTRILIVDDDAATLELLEDILKEEDYEILKATGGTVALQTIEEESLDVVILDIIMPHLDGYEVLRIARNFTRIPIIMLSVLRGIEDKVKCLNLGADDYITKPFAVDELLARVKAALRRKNIKASLPSDSSFTIGDIKVNLINRQATVAGKDAKLTTTECKLLQELLSNRGEVVPFAYLLETIWGPEYRAERDYLYVFINRLRAKLGLNNTEPKHIVSVPGLGYRLNVPDEEPSNV